jgi:RNA polymerase sigma-70 factor (ECF subfamily)
MKKGQNNMVMHATTVAATSTATEREADFLRRYQDQASSGGDASQRMLFDELYSLYAPKIRTFLWRYADQHEVNDLVQESMIRVWTSLKHFRSESSLKSWIYAIALNVARDHLRKVKRLRWLQIVPDMFFAESIRDRRPNPQESSEHNALLTMIRKLSPKLKEVIVLYSLEDLSIEVIAEILHIPAGTVKSRLHQARIQLRAHLEQEEESYE